MFCPLQIGNGARQFEHAMEASRRKPQFFRGVAHEADPRLIQHDNLFDERSGSGRVAGNIRLSKRPETFALEIARCSDAGRHLRRTLRGRRQDQVEARIAPASR